MNTKITVSMVAAAVVAVSMAFVPASADTQVQVPAPGQVVSVIADETPAEAVHDMTYGADRPVLAARSDADESQANDETVDLSMG